MNSAEYTSLIVEVPIVSNTPQENVSLKGTCLDQVSCFEIGQWARGLLWRLVRVDTYMLGVGRVLECNGKPLDAANTLDTLETRIGMKPHGRSPNR
jgi:hypothetical protein